MRSRCCYLFSRFIKSHKYVFVLECKTRFIGTLGSNKVLSEVWRLFQYRDDMQTYKSYIPILFSWQVPISFPELALTFKTCILKTHSAWKIAYMSTRSPASVCKQYFLPLQMLSTYYWAYAKKILHAINWSALDNCVEESCVKYTDFLCQCGPWNSQPLSHSTSCKHRKQGYDQESDK